jgi:hypothetical protein
MCDEMLSRVAENMHNSRQGSLYVSEEARKKHLKRLNVARVQKCLALKWCRASKQKNDRANPHNSPALVAHSEKEKAMRHRRLEAANRARENEARDQCGAAVATGIGTGASDDQIALTKSRLHAAGSVAEVLEARATDSDDVWDGLVPGWLRSWSGHTLSCCHNGFVRLRCRRG